MNCQLLSIVLSALTESCCTVWWPGGRKSFWVCWWSWTGTAVCQWTHSSAWSNHSIKEDAGHHRLVRHLQHFCFVLFCFADVEDPSLLRKYRLCPFLCKVPIFAVQSSLSSSCSPRYLYVLTTSTSASSMDTGWRCGFFLLKSTTMSLVLEAFSCRWLNLHHLMKSLTRLLYSPSCPSLIQPTITVLSECLCMWQSPEFYWKLDVYTVKRTVASMVPCGAPVLLTTVSDMQPFSLMHCGLSGRVRL